MRIEVAIERYPAAIVRGKAIGTEFCVDWYQPEYWLATKSEYLKAEVRPWSPYQSEYSAEAAEQDHLSYVAEALSNGWNVPDEVLADYKELQVMALYLRQGFSESRVKNA